MRIFGSERRTRVPPVDGVFWEVGKRNDEVAGAVPEFQIWAHVEADAPVGRQIGVQPVYLDGESEPHNLVIQIQVIKAYAANERPTTSIVSAGVPPQPKQSTPATSSARRGGPAHSGSTRSRTPHVDQSIHSGIRVFGTTVALGLICAVLYHPALAWTTEQSDRTHDDLGRSLYSFATWALRWWNVSAVTVVTVLACAALIAVMGLWWRQVEAVNTWAYRSSVVVTVSCLPAVVAALTGLLFMLVSLVIVVIALALFAVALYFVLDSVL